MKTLITLLTLISFGTLAETLYGQTGRFCPGDTLTVRADGDYVERVLISAEGIRNDGFIKVYADGELVFNVGVPGYDPDYSFRVRREVEELTFKFERTCSRVLDLKVFTASSRNTNSRRYRASTFTTLTWGSELMEMINSAVSFENGALMMDSGLWTKFLLPLKKLALSHHTHASVRDPRSIEATYFALRIARMIFKNQAKLERMLDSGHSDGFLIDLLTISEDILEAYDVRKSKLDEEIEELKDYLEL